METDIFNDTHKIAESRMEQVMEAIKAQDKEALKSMFSEKAISESDDFDGSLDQLFEFIQGEIETWESLSGTGSGSGSGEAGRVTKTEVRSYYYVNTDKQRYYFAIRDFCVDAENPENVGFYLMIIAKEEDRNKIYAVDQKILFDGNVKIPRVGIYIPFE